MNYAVDVAHIIYRSRLAAATILGPFFKESDRKTNFMPRLVYYYYFFNRLHVITMNRYKTYMMYKYFIILYTKYARRIRHTRLGEV